MNNEYMPFVTVYLAIQKKGDLEYIKQVINKKHLNPNIKIVESPDIFHSLTGLMYLVEKYQNSGLVYIKSEEVRIEGIRIAVKRGLPFVMLLRNSSTGERIPVCQNQIKRTQTVRRRFRHRRFAKVGQ